MTIKEFDKETEKINDERVVERRKLERDQINKHIAERDARRVEKQRLEDMGWTNIHLSPPPPEPTIEEKVIEDKKEFTESVTTGTIEFEVLTTDDGKTEFRTADELIEPVDITPVEEILEEELIPEEIIEEALAEEIQEEPKVEEVLDAQEQLREAVVDAKAQLNDNIGELEQIDQVWIDEYKTETGKNAIWNGKITAGFKDFCLNVLGIDLG